MREESLSTWGCPRRSFTPVRAAGEIVSLVREQLGGRTRRHPDQELQPAGSHAPPAPSAGNLVKLGFAHV